MGFFLIPSSGFLFYFFFSFCDFNPILLVTAIHQLIWLTDNILLVTNCSCLHLQLPYVSQCRYLRSWTLIGFRVRKSKIKRVQRKWIIFVFNFIPIILVILIFSRKKLLLNVTCNPGFSLGGTEYYWPKLSDV